ncbi:MAG: hypothetical protein NT033_06820 [Candidatus Omnitrophica bacterium]|nr:hypothetical protein [Candidatus Omnitrophota bacterium]
MKRLTGIFAAIFLLAGFLSVGFAEEGNVTALDTSKPAVTTKAVAKHKKTVVKKQKKNKKPKQTKQAKQEQVATGGATK